MKLLITFLLIVLPASLAAQSAGIGVKVPITSAKNRQKSFRSAILVLDQSARRATVTSKEIGRVDMPYDSVEKVVIEPNVRVSYSAGAAIAGFALGGAAFGGRIAASIDNPVDMAHTVYLEFRKPDGSSARMVVSVDKENVPMALRGIKDAFGDRASLAAFTETPEALDIKRLPTAQIRLLVKGNMANRPVPATRSDKAMVLVACPTGNGIDAVRLDKFQNWGAYVVSTDQVIAVNAPGTYTFFYLDPGDYTLVSQTQDASGLRMKLEAGKDYYLIQTMYLAGKMKSFLTRHSKELVMHEVSDLAWSEWKSKE